MDEQFLWPTEDKRPREHDGSELIGTYLNRAEVPREQWLSLLTEATEQIDMLVFSGTFIAQTNPRIATMLAAQAAQGVRIRLCFGDPDGTAVVVRGREEGIGDTLAAKVKASLTYYRSLVTEAGCEIRLHDTTLYNSLFRYDQNLLVNPHIWGQPASANPILSLRRVDEHGWFDRYTESFDAIWADAQPWKP